MNLAMFLKNKNPIAILRFAIASIVVLVASFMLLMPALALAQESYSDHCTFPKLKVDGAPGFEHYYLETECGDAGSLEPKLVEITNDIRNSNGNLAWGNGRWFESCLHSAMVDYSLYAVCRDSAGEYGDNSSLATDESICYENGRLFVNANQDPC
ncbi:MAG: hypothetical protein F6J87_27620 [Spirulina sp. SIO3F2]|nr:hypothetical protein [Spirulina sp. SIO3F2]